MPSTSPRSAPTSVRRPSCAYASTASSASAASSAATASSRRSGTGASDGDLRDAQRGRTAADGRRLAVLAADALPRVEVVGNRVDVLHDVHRATDQVRAADRLRDLAVLDQVAERDAEDEVAARG